MKPRVLAAVALIWLPLVCYGQSTLSFPRVMQPRDFSTTGFALLNPAPGPATVTYTLYDTGGTSQATATQTINPRGQVAKLGSELFPGTSTAGWVQATSSISGLQGFWFAGDLSTFADGAEAAPSSTDVIMPLVSADSEIHIVNTGATEITIRLNLLGADGFDLAEPYPQRIAPKGSFSRDVLPLFGTVTDWSLPTHMRITCPCTGASPFAATLIARNFIAAPSWAVSNGVPSSSPATTIYFPHLVEGPQGAANWKSVVGLTNLSATPNDVLLTFTSETGTSVRTVQQTLAARGGLRMTASDLFGFAGGFQNGWVRVTSISGLPVTGYIAYADLIAAGVAVVPPQQDAQDRLLFAHIADLPPWLTGLALLNPNASGAAIDIFAMSPNGSLIGTTSLFLDANTKTARLLGDLIPQTRTRSTDGGFVFVQSSLPIYGIELFFSRNLQVLANVPGGPGITFVPPPR